MADIPGWVWEEERVRGQFRWSLFLSGFQGSRDWRKNSQRLEEDADDREVY